jgi:hypothetical protein
MAKVISLPGLFASTGYHPHDVQWKIHRAMQEHRFSVVCAGRRTGKSTTGGNALVPFAYKALFQQAELSRNGKRSEFWIVGPEYSDGEKEFRVLYNAMSKLDFPFDKPGTYNNMDSGQMDISLWDGRFQVHVKSAKYPDNLVGEALQGVILAEAAKLKPKIWTKFVRPMLADYRGWALMTSTPEGRNWFYDAYMRGKNEDPGWWSIRMPSWSNNILFPGGRFDPEILDMSKDLTEEMFKQEIGAEFTEFVGRVFKNWDEDVHAKPLKYNPLWPTYAAVDYGWTNPFVWLVVQVDPWDNVYILDEYYERHKMIDDIPKELLSRGLVPATMKTFYPDPASPGDTAVLEKKLGLRGVGGTGGEVKERLDLIRKWLKPNHPYLDEGSIGEEHPDVKPKLFVDSRKCPNFLREFDAYRYPENKSEARNDAELPLKKDDHTPEALGRFMMGHFGKQEAPHRTRVRKGRMSAGRAG